MVVSPGDPHMKSMALLFMLDLVDPGPSDPCLSVTSSLIPRLEKYLKVVAENIVIKVTHDKD